MIRYFTIILLFIPAALFFLVGEQFSPGVKHEPVQGLGDAEIWALPELSRCPCDGSVMSMDEQDYAVLVAWEKVFRDRERELKNLERTIGRPQCADGACVCGMEASDGTD